jgi:hypothetical protein
LSHLLAGARRTRSGFRRIRFAQHLLFERDDRKRL